MIFSYYFCFSYSFFLVSPHSNIIIHCFVQHTVLYFHIRRMDIYDFIVHMSEVIWAIKTKIIMLRAGSIFILTRAQTLRKIRKIFFGKTSFSHRTTTKNERRKKSIEEALLEKMLKYCSFELFFFLKCFVLSFVYWHGV